jgi:hypothetical protein
MSPILRYSSFYQPFYQSLSFEDIPFNSLDLTALLLAPVLWFDPRSISSFNTSISIRSLPPIQQQTFCQSHSSNTSPTQIPVHLNAWALEYQPFCSISLRPCIPVCLLCTSTPFLQYQAFNMNLSSKTNPIVYPHPSKPTHDWPPGIFDLCFLFMGPEKASEYWRCSVP